MAPPERLLFDRRSGIPVGRRWPLLAILAPDRRAWPWRSAGTMAIDVGDTM